MVGFAGNYWRTPVDGSFKFLVFARPGWNKRHLVTPTQRSPGNFCLAGKLLKKIYVLERENFRSKKRKDGGSKMMVTCCYPRKF